MAAFTAVPSIPTAANSPGWTSILAGSVLQTGHDPVMCCCSHCRARFSCSLVNPMARASCTQRASTAVGQSILDFSARQFGILASFGGFSFTCRSCSSAVYRRLKCTRSWPTAVMPPASGQLFAAAHFPLRTTSFQSFSSSTARSSMRRVSRSASTLAFFSSATAFRRAFAP